MVTPLAVGVHLACPKAGPTLERLGRNVERREGLIWDTSVHIEQWPMVRDDTGLGQIRIAPSTGIHRRSIARRSPLSTTSV